MRILFFLFSAIMSVCSLAQSVTQDGSAKHNFISGEQLKFNLNYGWFNVGSASLQVSDTMVYGADCYQVEIVGQTAGFLSLFTRVDDTWGAFIEKLDLLPLVSYSDIEEGNYTRRDEVFFDKQAHHIKVDKIRSNKKNPTKNFDYEGEMNDLMSGYLKLRNIDFNKLRPSDTIRFKAFYNESFYDFGLIYKGKKLLKSKVGKQMAHQVQPILPENNIFRGEASITAWISADKDQLPLKIEAQMFFGHATCTLVDYKNIKFGKDYE
jgi:hypothetical protein